MIATIRPARRVQKRIRGATTGIALALAFGALVLLLGRVQISASLPLYDFVEYWTAARLNLAGGDPYSAAQALALQQPLGWTGPDPVRMWNPPWALGLLMPLGILSFPAARLGWLLLNALVIFLAAIETWRLYGGKPAFGWLAGLLGLMFVPSLDALKLGQASPLLLLGVAGFMRFARRGQWWRAGACAALVAIKPQLLHLFWIALVLYAVDRRRWGILGGLTVALAGGLGVALAFNSQVLAQYAWAVLHDGPTDWMTPTVGTVLRMIFGPEKFWLQFLAPCLSLAWLAFYWSRHRETWDWAEQAPVLLLASLVTTSYGWVYDQSLLVVALVQVLALLSRAGPRRLPWLLLAGYVALQAALWLFDAWQVWAQYYAWSAPAMLLLYLAAHTNVQRSHTISHSICA